MDGEELAKLGQEAAGLMEELIEDEGLPDGTIVEKVGLVVVVKVPGEDGEDDEETTYIRCSTDSTLEQVGLFAMATNIAYE